MGLYWEEENKSWWKGSKESRIEKKVSDGEDKK